MLLFTSVSEVIDLQVKLLGRTCDCKEKKVPISIRWKNEQIKSPVCKAWKVKIDMKGFQLKFTWVWSMNVTKDNPLYTSVNSKGLMKKFQLWWITQNFYTLCALRLLNFECGVTQFPHRYMYSFHPFHNEPAKTHTMDGYQLFMTIFISVLPFLFLHGIINLLKIDSI